MAYTDIHTSIKKAADDLSLRSEERERMRHTIAAYMEMKPMRAPQAVFSPYHAFSWLLSPRRVALLTIAALFASSVGVSYAAQNALPGDALYPVKVSVNEPMRGALATSAAAKTAWAIDVAGERVKEEVALAAAGRLSSSTERELQENFTAHADIAAAAIGKESGENPEIGSEHAVRFEAQLDEYSRILGEVAAARGSDVGSIRESVQKTRVHLSTIRSQADVALSSASSTERLAAAARTRESARRQIDASLTLMRAALPALASSSASAIATQLQDASASVSHGEQLLGESDAPQALGTFQDALSAAEQVRVFLQTSAAIHQKTGLVVGEPDTQSSRASSTPERGMRGVRHARGSERGFRGHDEVVATSSAEGSGQTAPETQHSSPSSGSRGGSDEAQDTHVLPISAPTPNLP